MEFLIVILILSIIVLPIIALGIAQSGNSRTKELEKELKQLREEFSSFVLQQKKNPEETSIQNKPAEVINKEPEKDPIPVPRKQPVNVEVVNYTVPQPVIPTEEVKKKPVSQPDYFDKVLEQTRTMTASEWEALIGGKILNRIGALAIVMGVGFFLKYAFDNNWITETVRVLIGLVIGILLLIAGHYYNKKSFVIFSTGLLGAGIAILYLSAYATFNYYHLVSQPIAFVMMIAVTLVSFWQAFKYNSIVIALFGWLGGTLTPFLLSTGVANETGLFTYLAFLDVGLLLIAFKRTSWAILEPLAMLSTIIIYSSWYWSYFLPDKCLLTAFFLAGFWIIFLAFEITRIYLTERKITWLNQGVSLANGAFFFTTFYMVINSVHHDWLGALTVLISAVYLGIYLFTRKRRATENYLLTRYLLSAILLSVFASLIQFRNFEITVAVAIESLFLAYMARRDKNEVLYISAAALLAFSILFYCSVDGAFRLYVSIYKPLFNMRNAALGSIFVSAFGSGMLINRNEFRFSLYIRRALTCTWFITLFTFITVETNDFFMYLSSTSSGDIELFYSYNIIWFLIFEWTVLALSVFYYGIRKKLLFHQYAGLSVALLAVLFCLLKGFEGYFPYAMFLPILNARTLAIIALAVGMLLVLKGIRKEQFSYSQVMEKIFSVSVVAVIFILLTADTTDIFEKKIYLCKDCNYGTEKLTDIGYLKQLCLSGVWLLYSITLMIAGIYRRNFGIRIISIILFGITIIKIFFYDLSNLDTLHRIFSFIGLGVTLLLVSYLYHKFKEYILPEKKGQQ